MPKSDDRNVKERRRHKKWSATERRHGGDRRDGAYSDFARKLPAEFTNMHGSPRERVMRLVNQYCRGCDEKLQADLAQALLPTLQAIVTLDGGMISEEHRQACEAAVERCVNKNELATGRWETACTDDEEQ
jgi:hypothetical protein